MSKTIETVATTIFEQFSTISKTIETIATTIFEQVSNNSNICQNNSKHFLYIPKGPGVPSFLKQTIIDP